MNCTDLLPLKMFFYSFQISALKTYVVENKLERRSAQWVPIDDDLFCFQWFQVVFSFFLLMMAISLLNFLCVYASCSENKLITIRCMLHFSCQLYVIIFIYSSTKSWKIPIGNGTYYTCIVTNERHLVS
jgi:sterol desaturase/sphingolipid hydroxylase (fatty acid hydroxylase superfamily)